MKPRRYDLDAEIVLFFKEHAPTTRQQCDSLAISLLGEPIEGVPIQGQFSYTLLAGPEPTIIQFRSIKSQLDLNITSLAKSIHGTLAAKTKASGVIGDNIFVYIIERLPEAYIGVRFFAASWIQAQPRPEIQLQNEYDRKLEQLAKSMPPYLTEAIVFCRTQLGVLFGSDFRWALCHGDINEMNLLVDEKTRYLTGVVDWAEASVQPFGLSLWGLETLLGYSDRDGWHYYSSSNALEGTFWTAFEDETNDISEDDKKIIDISRRVGMLLRYGFIWINGVETMITE
ncbi:hypothetical protein MaudCBS49596_004172 [Microsporum audouinii]